MHKAISKILAYIILIIGIIIVITLILAIAAIFIYVPNPNSSKQIITSGVLAMIALIIGFISIALFEFIIETGEKLSQNGNAVGQNTVPEIEKNKLDDLKKVVKKQ